MLKEISIKNFENRMKTLETKNTKKHGHSLTWCSLLNNFNKCIVEISESTITFDEEKYKAIRKEIMRGEK